MNGARESRLAGNQAAEVLTDNPILSQRVQRVPRLIGASVETELEATLWRLMDGSIDTWQLTPALAAWWHVAYTTGAGSLQGDLEQARADADRYYELAMNPGIALTDIKQRRIDIALFEAEQAGALVTEADVVRTVIAACAPRGGAQ